MERDGVLFEDLQRKWYQKEKYLMSKRRDKDRRARTYLMTVYATDGAHQYSGVTNIQTRNFDSYFYMKDGAKVKTNLPFLAIEEVAKPELPEPEELKSAD